MSATGASVRFCGRGPDEGRPGGGRPYAAPKPGVLRVLIVEDELLVAWHLEAMLEDLGHEVCAISPSADAALGDFSDQGPDLVFMDVNLGAGRNGIETARALLALGALPLVFVTAYGDAATRAAMAEAAPNGLMLSKPVSAADLARAIEVVTAPRH